MKKKILITLSLLLGFTAVSVPAEAHTGFKRVAYFIQWGVYGRDYHVKDVDVTGAAAKLTARPRAAFTVCRASSGRNCGEGKAEWRRKNGAIRARGCSFSPAFRPRFARADARHGRTGAGWVP